MHYTFNGYVSNLVLLSVIMKLPLFEFLVAELCDTNELHNWIRSRKVSKKVSKVNFLRESCRNDDS